MNTFKSLILVAVLLAASTVHSEDIQGHDNDPASQAMGPAHDAKADFDFAMGEWEIENHKLLHSLAGSEQWETFHAHLLVKPLPGKIGNYDEWTAEQWRPGFVGMALRVFNPKTQLWTIYWLTNIDGGLDSATGALTPPVVGKFDGNIGVFVGPDMYDGKPILVRFTWTKVGDDRARWEQAFSADQGKNWETNWKMEMKKAVR